jgi:hypothetical protein
MVIIVRAGGKINDISGTYEDLHKMWPAKFTNERSTLQDKKVFFVFSFFFLNSCRSLPFCGPIRARDFFSRQPISREARPDAWTTYSSVIPQLPESNGDWRVHASPFEIPMTPILRSEFQ